VIGASPFFPDCIIVSGDCHASTHFRDNSRSVDFSEISAHALRTASLLAARCGRAKIVAMYANWFEAPPYFTVGRLAELQAEFSESLHLAEHSLEAFVRSTLGITPIQSKFVRWRRFPPMASDSWPRSRMQI